MLQVFSMSDEELGALLQFITGSLARALPWQFVFTSKPRKHVFYVFGFWSKTCLRYRCFPSAAPVPCGHRSV